MMLAHDSPNENLRVQLARSLFHAMEQDMAAQSELLAAHARGETEDVYWETPEGPRANASSTSSSAA